eukprot:8844449-Pyramimonas_sp.AAC.1
MANQLRVRIEGGAHDHCVTQLTEAPRWQREGATRDRRAKEKGLSADEDTLHRCVNLPIILRHYQELGMELKSCLKPELALDAPASIKQGSQRANRSFVPARTWAASVEREGGGHDLTT